MIKNDRLVGVEQLPPIKTNKTSSGVNTREFIVIHYTAGPNAQSAHNNFNNPEAQVSWHLTIDRDGKVYQLLPFSAIAWHAGKSEWTHGDKKYSAMNPVSIGIELVNAGNLTKKGEKFFTWYNKEVPADEVFFDEKGMPWHKFTDAQINTTIDLTLKLAKHFSVKDILGHNEISPGRKVDPGPAFSQYLELIRKAYKGKVCT